MAIPKYIVIPIIRFHDLAVQLTESANCFYQVYLFTVVLLSIAFHELRSVPTQRQVHTR